MAWQKLFFQKSNEKKQHALTNSVPESAISGGGSSPDAFQTYLRQIPNHRLSSNEVNSIKAYEQRVAGALSNNRVVEGIQIVDEMLSEFNAIYLVMLGMLYGVGGACFTFLCDGRRARFLFEACNDLLLTWRTSAPLQLRNSIMLNLALLADGYENHKMYAHAYECGAFPTDSIQKMFEKVIQLKAMKKPWRDAQMEMALCLGEQSGAQRPTTLPSEQSALLACILLDASEKNQKASSDFWHNVFSQYQEALRRTLLGYQRLGGPEPEAFFHTVQHNAVERFVAFGQAHPELSEVSAITADLQGWTIDKFSGGHPHEQEADDGFTDVDEWIALSEAGQYRTLQRSYEQANREPVSPMQKLLLSHNCALFYWTSIGWGTRALDLFTQEWELSFDFSASEKPMANSVLAQAAENAMLLSPSIETFRLWRERLKRLVPDAPILQEDGARFDEQYKNGTPWWECMSKFALQMYNRNDPSRDQGRYGEGAAIWQLILENRKAFRLPADIWRMAAVEYGALTTHMVALVKQKHEKDVDYDPQEATLPVEIALPYLEEYSRAYPGDEVVDGMILEDMHAVLKKAN